MSALHPLAGGSLSVLRYRVVGEDGRRQYSQRFEAVQAHSFPFGDPTISAATRVGWCDAWNPFAAPSGKLDTFQDGVMVLGLRVEQRKVPAHVLRAHCDVRVRAWLEETGRETIHPSARREIKDAVESELLGQTMPVFHVYPVLWHMESGEVWLQSASATVAERFRALFRETFDLMVRPLNACALIAREGGGWRWWSEALRPLAYSSFARDERADATAPTSQAPSRQDRTAKAEDEDGDSWGGPDDPSDHVANRWLGQEFFVWLWWQSELGLSAIDLPRFGRVEVWVDDLISFRSRGEKQATFKLRGGAPSTTTEARTALAEGRLIDELRLGLRAEDHEYALTIRAAGFRVLAVRLPALTDGDGDEVLLEKAFFLNQAFELVECALHAYAAARVGREWPSILQALRRWIHDDEL